MHFPGQLRRPVRGRLLPILLGVAMVGLAGCGDGGDDLHLTSSGTTIVCFGDSVTAGSGAAADRSYPARLEEYLGVPVINAGRPGDTTADGLDRLARILELDPWLVVVELGGNDFLRRLPVERAEDNLAGIVGALTAQGVAVVLIEVEPPMLGGGYSGLHRRLAERFGVRLVEGVVEEVLSDPGRKSDQIHPNAAGYADIARAVARVVHPLVEERQQAGLPVTAPVPAGEARQREAA